MKKRAGRFLTAALVLLTFAMLCPVFAAEDGNTAAQTGDAALHQHAGADGSSVSFSEWTDPTGLPTDGGAWYLGTDVTLERDWMLAADTKLCLNGHVVSTDDGSCLWIEEISLELYDETDGAAHYFRFREGSA